MAAFTRGKKKKKKNHQEESKVQPGRLNVERYVLRKFHGGPVVKNLPASAGKRGSIPGPERVHMPQGS